MKCSAAGFLINRAETNYRSNLSAGFCAITLGGSITFRAGSNPTRTFEAYYYFQNNADRKLSTLSVRIGVHLRLSAAKKVFLSRPSVELELPSRAGKRRAR